ncbi:hypothetical protein AB0L70_08380 [Kribbella sp. NPDC051952]|uniref:hypothetical protein n=1 Tax=Kribbella sp. NPDC051952 TaxID=3154851 RepID=UPI003430658E
MTLNATTRRPADTGTGWSADAGMRWSADAGLCWSTDAGPCCTPVVQLLSPDSVD